VGKAATSNFNFTKKAIERLPQPEGRRSFHYDTATKGLGVMVQRSGHRSFFWLRKVRGSPSWKTIGDFPDLSVENARMKADKLNVKLAQWKADDYDGPNPFEQKPNLALVDVFEDYVTQHLKKHSSNPDKAVKQARWMLDGYLTPWKNRRIGSVQKRDVEKLHTSVAEKHGSVTANRLVTFLRTLFYYAQRKMGWAGRNPARNPGRERILVKESSRRRFIQEEEMARFLATLRQEVNADLQDFVVIALFTGVRSGDIMAMRWDQISGIEWHVPNRKKPDEPYIAPLEQEVIERLKERRKRAGDSPWVFPSGGKTGHIMSFKRSWKQFLKRAKVSDLRIHDLRRTLASWQARQGTSLAIIGKTLGHSDSLKSTEVYARLQTGSVRQSVNQATRAMLDAKDSEPDSAEEENRG